MKTGTKMAPGVNNSNSGASSKATASKKRTSDFIDSIPSMLDEELDNIVVTFHFKDGSIKMLQCNKSGFYDERGRCRLSSNKIFNNMQELRHDFNALYFIMG